MTQADAAALATVKRQLKTVLSRDYGRLLGRWRQLIRHFDADRLTKLQAEIAGSAAQRGLRAASVPNIELDTSLPISNEAERLIELIRSQQILVLAGETGSGKTTQLPKLCLAAGRGVAGMIGCCQPRRLAARAVAGRVAAELGVELGGLVGYQVRFTERVSEASLVKFMTDGILLAEIQQDPWLSAYDTLILDEAHERSLNIDFLLGYLKRLAARRPALKIIVTSATIDTARFAAHFDRAPVVTVEGRSYPVELRWRPVEALAEGGRLQQGSAEHIALALDELCGRRGASANANELGDVLVFLPGEREIRDLHRVLVRRAYWETEVLPLYARLAVKDQDRIFKPGPKRRIVLATNVAETSLTVPRIRYVVDSGLARVKRYSQRSQLERLHIEPISRAAADQRKGRCGRLGPGICIRLYSEQDFIGRPAFTDPELLRSSLANVILRMLALQLGEVEAFPFLDPPAPKMVADGYRRLSEISAINEQRQLTELGRRLARWPIDVALARMLLEGGERGETRALLVIVAYLSVQDPRERPPEVRQQAAAAHAAFVDPSSDFLAILKLWQAYDTSHEELSQAKLRDWCGRHFLSYLRMREWRELHRQLLGLWREREGELSGAKAAPVEPDASPLAVRRYEAIHCSLLAGLPTQIGCKDEQGGYRGARARRFQVFPGSALAKAPPPWIFAAQILDLGGKVWGMGCARVEPAWIEAQAAHLVRSRWDDPHWSRPRGVVLAYEQVSLFGLPLVERRPVLLKRRDPALAHAIFVREALARCDLDAQAACIRDNRRVLRAAEEVEARQRRSGLIRDEAELAGFFTGKLPPEVADSRALDAWYRRAAPAVRASLHWSLADVLEPHPGLDAGAFPACLELPPHRYRLHYRFLPGDPADGISLDLPLAMLNTLSAARCEWLVPGMLSDKVAELIRGLPKALRRHFVPAADFARAFCEAEAPRDQRLTEALAKFLRRVTGVAINPEDFVDLALSAHFSMRYRLRDERGKVLAESRSLEALRTDWSDSARAAFACKADPEWERERVDSWDFATIPERVHVDAGLIAYPALVDLGDAAALKVFEQQAEAAQAHRAGVIRLCRQALSRDIKEAHRRLPIGAAIGLRYAAWGRVDELREQLVEGALQDLWRQHEPAAVRTAEAFQILREQLARGLFAAAVERLRLAEIIIDEQAALKPWLEPARLGQAPASYQDLQQQVQALLAPGCLQDLDLSRLAKLPRYLKAMRLRGERLRHDTAKDQQRMLQVAPYWRLYLKHQAKHPITPDQATALQTLRWLIEEWRVSLFAQELKTAAPVSAKRMAQAAQALEALMR